ncbi:MAG: DJ-1/PfpI family protein [Spirochaetaceae bacterium]|nr:DJ-1/PfpI family protein [Spirochaetaceae bacterium]
MNKKMLIFLADGFEEVEAFTPIDYLRRAGIEVCTVALGEDKIITGSHKITVIADESIANIKHTDDFDGVLIPGGMPGSANLAESALLNTLLQKTNEKNRLICAICAAPVIVLYPQGLLHGRKWTCFPGMEDKAIEDKSGFSEKNLVIDGNLITSRAAGTAAAWALAIIESLAGKTAADKIASSVLLNV